MAVKSHIEVFWVVTSCSVMVGYKRFGGLCCFSLHPGGSMDIWNISIQSPHYMVSSWRWRQHGPPKRWCPARILHGVTTQKTSTWFMHLYSVSVHSE